ncbi:hypothetical protein, partial [Holdemania massiliensis]|uniref:hypothetical protein n=1 Tax=Holdemania massiliensis TaxID=1468449 RepID=UPI00242BD86D
VAAANIYLYDGADGTGNILLEIHGNIGLCLAQRLTIGVKTGMILMDFYDPFYRNEEKGALIYE